jgi:hypothetical protein
VVKIIGFCVKGETMLDFLPISRFFDFSSGSQTTSFES